MSSHKLAKFATRVLLFTITSVFLLGDLAHYPCHAYCLSIHLGPDAQGVEDSHAAIYKCLICLALVNLLSYILCSPMMFPKPLDIVHMILSNFLRDTMVFIELAHAFLITCNHVKRIALSYGQLFNQIVIGLLFIAS